jgi:hypothetical protein
MTFTDDDLIDAVRAAVADRDLPPPATPADVTRVERELGHPMPPLLRRLYLEVANGGFGPWECVSLTETDHWFSDAQDILEANHDFASRNDPDLPVPPPGVVPLMDFGSGMWAMVDLRTEQGRIWDWDPGQSCVLAPTTLSLAQWLQGWLEGRIVEGPHTEYRDRETA